MLVVYFRWTAERLFSLYHRCGPQKTAWHGEIRLAVLAAACSSCRTFWLDTPDGTRKLYAGALKIWVLYIDELKAQGRDVDYCVHPHSKVSQGHGIQMYDNICALCSWLLPDPGGFLL